MPEKPVNRARITKKTVLGALTALVLVPCLLFFTWRYASHSYYLCGLVLILCGTVPFLASFERRRPQARELVTLAVMCAIAAASRTAFIFVPHFKPMSGIIMITAAAFGPETGFLTGLISAFVSNFIFGQGPWTPWQMFAYGMGGFLTGLLSRAGFLRGEQNVRFAVAGAALVMLVVGPLLDTSTLLMMSTLPGRAAAGAVYLSGLPVNAVHALATFLTILLLSRPITEKLERMKVKYGILSGES